MLDPLCGVAVKFVGWLVGSPNGAGMSKEEEVAPVKEPEVNAMVAPVTAAALVAVKPL